MNRTSALGRKLIYLGVLLAMLIPLYLLGQPSGGGADVGGRLSEMRHHYNIAESDLGEISPASQTMKLASLGLRGVAATLLWNKTHEYRVTHEWDRLKAAVNNIALLQPHSERVWEFHAHNLSYNVSTEFDDYRQRYAMVREGTEFLQKGVRQNRNATRLVWYTGWFYGSKLGMSDEKEQFRRLFADDEVLHEALLQENIAVDSPEARGPLGDPDNWLVGRLWLYRGYGLVERGVKIRRQTPLNFYETGPKWRIKHAEAIAKEGILDERSQSRWQMASEDWIAFGDRSIPTTSPFTIKLGHLEELTRQREQQIDNFIALTGDAYVRARQEMIDELPLDQQALLNTFAVTRSEEDAQRVAKIERRLTPDLTAVAKDSDESVLLQAISLRGEIADLDARINKTVGYRTQINFPYWHTLSIAEQEERTVTARRMIYDAEQANSEARLDEAIELYEQAFEIWAEIFDDYPVLTIDDTAEDLVASIQKYMVAIDSQDFPDDFPLLAFIEFMSQPGGVNAISNRRTHTEIRESMEESIKERRRELEAEERLREEEASKEETAETEKDAGEKDAGEKDAGEEDAGEEDAVVESQADAEKDPGIQGEPDVAKPDDGAAPADSNDAADSPSKEGDEESSDSSADAPETPDGGQPETPDGGQPETPDGGQPETPDASS